MNRLIQDGILFKLMGLTQIDTVIDSERIDDEK